MTLIRSNTPNTQNMVGLGQKIPVKQIQDFTKSQPITQGFRFSLTQGNNPFPIVLTQPGIKLLGVSVIGLPLTDLQDTYVTFRVNKYLLLENVHALQLCPNYALGQIVFPTPFLLAGNDQISVSFEKNDAGNITTGFVVHYLPQ
jgi:hypothetical protein